MCIDMSDVALQRALPRLQSAHISVLRDVSGVDLVRFTIPHGESRESYLACTVVVHATMCVDMPDANRLSVLSSDACHMCVDLPIHVQQLGLSSEVNS